MITTLQDKMLQRAPGVRFRYDKFGGLAWHIRGFIYQLSAFETILLDVLAQPIAVSALVCYLPERDLKNAIHKLAHENLIVFANSTTDIPLAGELKRANSLAIESRNQPLNKPFWAHLQPFTFCNQKCIHCYCNGGSHQSKHPLPLTTWKRIVDKIAEFGVIEIYVTGGENLIVDEYYDITEHILSAGCTTGLSTNAMFVPDRAIEFISKHHLSYVQVSLDGATAVTNDRIRGVRGAFEHSLRGLRKLSQVTKPILNMVVNRLNVTEIEALVVLGKEFGVSYFKFYPQKTAGRARDCLSLKLTQSEWNAIPFVEIGRIHGVNVEYLSHGDACGSGFSGFAINEYGDMFPCIFGCHNTGIRVGSILARELSYLWFHAEPMTFFRGLANSQPCCRCECP